MNSRLTRALVAALALAAVVTGGSASASGGGPTSVLLGGKGVTSPDGKTRYVALTTGRHTIVSAVRVDGGRVVRWRQLRGYFGVPVVTVTETTDGVSRDGRTLVLATPAGGRVTEFALLDTRTWKLRRVTLRGSWSYDAISPDGRTLYLVQYAGVSANPSYRVRAYDLRRQSMRARAIVDREVGQRLMRGWPVARKSSSSGRWAYTLYARAKGVPFVHALDTLRRQAYCIDVPVPAKRAEQMSMRLTLRRDRALEIRRGTVRLATVDTKTFVVHRH
jgi:hypothetical protein